MKTFQPDRTYVITHMGRGECGAHSVLPIGTKVTVVRVDADHESCGILVRGMTEAFPRGVQQCVSPNDLSPVPSPIIWSLTIDGDYSVVTTLHATEADAIASLRENYDEAGEHADVEDDDILQTLIDEQGLSIYLDSHDLTFILPNLTIQEN